MSSLHILILISCVQVYIPVDAARMNTLVVKPDKQQQGFLPKTLADLVSRAVLGAKSSLRVSSDQDVSTALGVKLRRLVQTFGGYEVYGSVVSAEVTMGGSFTGQMSGDIVLDLSDDIADPEACQRSIDDVIGVAAEAEGLLKRDSRIQEKDGRRIAFVRENDGKGVMAYAVDFFVDKIIKRPFYIIDACDNTVYTSFNLIQNSTIHREQQRTLSKRQADEDCEDCDPSVPGYGGNQKIGRYSFGEAPQCLRVSQSGSRCTMQSRYVKVVNNRGSTSRSITTAVSFTCASGYTDPYGNRNGAYGVANDAMYFGHITGAFYESKYSFRALSWVPRMVVHYGNSYENAFWTGRDMFFGDGQNRFYPFVCLDVTAHELAHGITSTNSNLEYRYQSGGINEAFSDISGEVIEHYTRGTNDWYVGADITKRSTALRYMSNPPRDGISIDHTRNYNNGMDVHHSSGVFNHAFYEMVRNNGMDIYDAYKCFLDANRSRWGRTTGFNSGACHVLRACRANGFDTDDARNAFTSVGISFSGCSLSLHEGVVFSGQSRSGILVSSTRNPILELSLDTGKWTITASAEDSSEISIVLAKDEEAKDVIKEKVGSIGFKSKSDDEVVYVKLKSPNRSDVKVTLQVN